MVSPRFDIISNWQEVLLYVFQSRQKLILIVSEVFDLRLFSRIQYLLLSSNLDNMHEYVVDCSLLEQNTFE